MDMNYRGMINMLIFCGCVGQAVAAGHTMSVRKNCARKPAVAAGLCARLEPPTAPDEQHLFFYNHSSQWRYEKVSAQELLHRSPMPVSTAVI